MLKKVASIPDKIYRYAMSNERSLPVGTYFDLNKKKIKSKGCYFELKNNQKLSNSFNVDCVDNYPIKDVKLVSGHLVQINGEYDLHVDPDFITDVAFNALASKNGKLKGSYIFVALSDKVKLTRVDGPLYKQIILSQSRRSALKLKKKDFKVGGVYSTPSGISAIYLGSINTQSPTYGGKKYDSYAVKNRMLFLTCSKEEPIFNINDINAYSLDVKKTHSFIEQNGTVNIPEDIVDILRNSMIKSFKSEMVGAAAKERGGYWLQYKFFKFCPLINMTESGKKMHSVFDVNKYMIYS